MARFVREYEDREERDRLKLRRFVEYTETRACRWNYLLDYFGRDDALPECLWALRPLRACQQFLVIYRGPGFFALSASARAARSAW